MKRIATVAVIALLTTGSLAGCGATSTSTAPSSTATSSTSQPTPTLGPGLQRVTAKRSHLTAGVPSTWEQVTASVFTNNPAAAERAAKQMKVPVSALKAFAARVDVIAFAPDGHTNLNVLLTDLAALPTPDNLRLQLSPLGAQISAITDTTTPLGAGEIVRYYLASVHGYGEGLFVTTSAGVVNLTVTAFTPAAAEADMNVVIPTLADTH